MTFCLYQTFTFMKRIFPGTIFVQLLPRKNFFLYYNILNTIKKDVVQQNIYFPHDAYFRVFPVFPSFLFLLLKKVNRKLNFLCLLWFNSPYIISKASAQVRSKRKMLLKISQNSTENNCWSLFHNEVADRLHKTKFSCSHYTFFI